MKNDIITLAKYLISKGVSEPLRLQKLLFFIRYEELKEFGHTPKNSFFQNDKNFQAWIYGPVNCETYRMLKKLFWGQDEKDEYILLDIDIKKIDKIYEKHFDKWNKCSSSVLVNKSHSNKSWINARNNIDSDKASNNYLIETDGSFLEFNDNN